MELHNKWMRHAIYEAKKAEMIGEVPIGAVIVYEDEIVAAAHNQRESTQQAVGHAEILAIQQANEKLQRWRLTGCTLYVTLEPCPMCAGAIIQSRIDTVVYGAADPKAGAVQSVIHLFDEPFNHFPTVVAHCLEEQCSTMLRTFFQRLRQKKKNTFK